MVCDVKIGEEKKNLRMQSDSGSGSRLLFLLDDHTKTTRNEDQRPKKLLLKLKLFFLSLHAVNSPQPATERSVASFSNNECRRSRTEQLETTLRRGVYCKKQLNFLLF